MTTALAIGTPVSGLDGTAGTSFYFTLDVQAQHAYRVTLTAPEGTTADVDLVYALNRAFEYGDEDDGSYSNTANEEFVYTSESDGTLDIVVYGYTGDFTGLSIVANNAAYVPLAATTPLTATLLASIPDADTPLNVQFAFATDLWVAWDNYSVFTSADGRAWTRRGDNTNFIFSGAPCKGPGGSYYFVSGGHVYKTTDFSAFVLIGDIPHATSASTKNLAYYGGLLYSFDFVSLSMATSPDGVTWTSAAATLPPMFSASVPYLAVAGGKLLLLRGAYSETSGPSYESRSYYTTNGTTFTLIPEVAQLSFSSSTAQLSGNILYGFKYVGSVPYLQSFDASTGVITNHGPSPLSPIELYASATHVVIYGSKSGDTTPSYQLSADGDSWAAWSPGVTNVSNTSLAIVAAPDGTMLFGMGDDHRGVIERFTFNAYATTMTSPPTPTGLLFTSAASLACDFEDAVYRYAHRANSVMRYNRNTGALVDVQMLPLACHIGNGQYVGATQYTTHAFHKYNAPAGVLTTSALSVVPGADSIYALNYAAGVYILTTSAAVFFSYDAVAWVDITAAAGYAVGRGGQTFRQHQGAAYYVTGAGELHVFSPTFAPETTLTGLPFAAGFNRKTRRAAWIDNGIFNLKDVDTGEVFGPYARVPTVLNNIIASSVLTPVGNGFVTFGGADGVVTIAGTQDGSMWWTATLVVPSPQGSLFGFSLPQLLFVDPTPARVEGTSVVLAPRSTFGQPAFPATNFAFVLDAPWLGSFWTGFVNCEES